MYRFQAYERNTPRLQEPIHAQGMKRLQRALTLDAEAPILLRLAYSTSYSFMASWNPLYERRVSTGVIPHWTPSSIRWLFNLRTEGKQGGAPWGYEITEAFGGELLHSHPIGRLSQGQRQLP